MSTHSSLIPQASFAVDATSTKTPSKLPSKDRVSLALAHVRARQKKQQQQQMLHQEEEIAPTSPSSSANRSQQLSPVSRSTRLHSSPTSSSSSLKQQQQPLSPRPLKQLVEDDPSLLPMKCDEAIGNESIAEPQGLVTSLSSNKSLSIASTMGTSGAVLLPQASSQMMVPNIRSLTSLNSSLVIRHYGEPDDDEIPQVDVEEEDHDVAVVPQQPNHGDDEEDDDIDEIPRPPTVRKVLSSERAPAVLSQATASKTQSLQRPAVSERFPPTIGHSGIERVDGSETEPVEEKIMATEYAITNETFHEEKKEDTVEDDEEEGAVEYDEEAALVGDVEGAHDGAHGEFEKQPALSNETLTEVSKFIDALSSFSKTQQMTLSLNKSDEENTVPDEDGSGMSPFGRRATFSGVEESFSHPPQYHQQQQQATIVDLSHMDKFMKVLSLEDQMLADEFGEAVKSMTSFDSGYQVDIKPETLAAIGEFIDSVNADRKAQLEGRDKTHDTILDNSSQDLGMDDESEANGLLEPETLEAISEYIDAVSSMHRLNAAHEPQESFGLHSSLDQEKIHVHSQLSVPSNVDREAQEYEDARRQSTGVPAPTSSNFLAVSTFVSQEVSVTESTIADQQHLPLHTDRPYCLDERQTTSARSITHTVPTSEKSYIKHRDELKPINSVAESNELSMKYTAERRPESSPLSGRPLGLDREGLIIENLTEAAEAFVAKPVTADPGKWTAVVTRLEDACTGESKTVEGRMVGSNLLDSTSLLELNGSSADDMLRQLVSDSTQSFEAIDLNSSTREVIGEYIDFVSGHENFDDCLLSEDLDRRENLDTIGREPASSEVDHPHTRDPEENAVFHGKDPDYEVQESPDKQKSRIEEIIAHVNELVEAEGQPDAIGSDEVAGEDLLDAASKFQIHQAGSSGIDVSINTDVVDMANTDDVQETTETYHLIDTKSVSSEDISPGVIALVEAYIDRLLEVHHVDQISGYEESSRISTAEIKEIVNELRFSAMYGLDSNLSSDVLSAAEEYIDTVVSDDENSVASRVPKDTSSHVKAFIDSLHTRAMSKLNIVESKEHQVARTLQGQDPTDESSAFLIQCLRKKAQSVALLKRDPPASSGSTLDEFEQKDPPVYETLSEEEARRSGAELNVNAKVEYFEFDPDQSTALKFDFSGELVTTDSANLKNHAAGDEPECDVVHRKVDILSVPPATSGEAIELVEICSNPSHESDEHAIKDMHYPTSDPDGTTPADDALALSDELQRALKIISNSEEPSGDTFIRFARLIRFSFPLLDRSQPTTSDVFQVTLECQNLELPLYIADRLFGLAFVAFEAKGGSDVESVPSDEFIEIKHQRYLSRADQVENELEKIRNFLSRLTDAAALAPDVETVAVAPMTSASVKGWVTSDTTALSRDTESIPVTSSTQIPGEGVPQTSILKPKNDATVNNVGATFDAALSQERHGTDSTLLVDGWDPVIECDNGPVARTTITAASNAIQMVDVIFERDDAVNGGTEELVEVVAREMNEFAPSLSTSLMEMSVDPDTEQGEINQHLSTSEHIDTKNATSGNKDDVDDPDDLIHVHVSMGRFGKDEEAVEVNLQGDSPEQEERALSTSGLEPWWDVVARIDGPSAATSADTSEDKVILRSKSTRNESDHSSRDNILNIKKASGGSLDEEMDNFWKGRQEVRERRLRYPQKRQTVGKSLPDCPSFSDTDNERAPKSPSYQSPTCSRSFESAEEPWVRKRTMAEWSPAHKWRNKKQWLSPRKLMEVEDPKPIDAVEAAEQLSAGKFRYRSRKRVPGTDQWKKPYLQRTAEHSGYYNVDVYSLYSAVIVVAPKHHLDKAPWEHRDVRQRFLHEQSISFRRNWFGSIRHKYGNPIIPMPVCKPKSMIMPMRAGEWTEEWYKKPWAAPLPTSDSANTGPTDYNSRFGPYRNPEEDEEQSWEERQLECGTFRNVKLTPGERISRLTPDLTSSLRRSRWRKKHFPRGTFPY